MISLTYTKCSDSLKNKIDQVGCLAYFLSEDHRDPRILTKVSLILLVLGLNAIKMIYLIRGLHV
jgi:hypothetical protein